MDQYISCHILGWSHAPAPSGREGGKRGLVTMCTASCSSTWKPGATNQIRDFEFIAKQRHTCSMRAHGRPCNFCSCLWRFLQLFHSTRMTRCTHGHQTPISPFPSSSWGVWHTRLILGKHPCGPKSHGDWRSQCVYRDYHYSYIMWDIMCGTWVLTQELVFTKGSATSSVFTMNIIFINTCRSLRATHTAPF